MVLMKLFTESWLDLTLSDPFQHSAAAWDIVWQVAHYFSRFKWVSTEHHISSLHSHLWVQLSRGNPFLWTDKSRNINKIIIIIIIINFKIFFSF